MSQSHYALHLLKSRQNVRSTAALLGVSDSFLFRRLRDIHYPKPSRLPITLSIDEFKGNASGQKFQAILTDPKNHKLFNILPSHSQVSLTQYFNEFSSKKEVRYFITDMNKVYRDLVKEYFPKASIVIDKFHVIRYVTWALENVRKRIQKQLHPSKRKYFKRSRKLLLTHQKNLSEESLLALEIMLGQSQDLATAYHQKELFYEFMASKSKAAAVPKLRTFILAAQVNWLNSKLV